MAAVSACGGGWHRLDDLTPQVLPARTQVQVWQGERVTLLHGVTLESDTLRGVPFIRVPTCDSCRVQVALVAVDSLRLGNKERRFFRAVGLALVIRSVWAYLFRGTGGD
jgi:hypothetical protein